MEYVHKQVINFRDGDRTPLQRRVSIGYEGDNLVERLEFVLPELVGGQVAKLMITGADAIMLNRVDDGRYAVDLTREMIGPDGKRDAHVRIDGVSGQIWQGGPLRIVTGKLPDVEEEIEKVYPTAVGQMLTAMAEHTGEMEAQEERVERAAQRAEEAAERAETGGGSGGPGEDGGYYQPSVTDGVLTWTPSKGNMPSVPESDIRGPKGDAGKDGKTAYRYAQDGGYDGTEAEFAEKLAQEIPEAYTLPVATADRLGGMMVGNGLTADEDGRVRVDPQKHYTKQETDAAISEATKEGVFELIEIITIEDNETLSIIRDKEPDGTPYNFDALMITSIYNGKASAYSMYIIPRGTGKKYICSIAVPWVSSTSASTGTKNIVKKVNGVWDGYGYSGSPSSNSEMAGAVNVNTVSEAKNCPYINEVEIKTTAIPFNAGLKITIWGVRA